MPKSNPLLLPMASESTTLGINTTHDVGYLAVFLAGLSSDRQQHPPCPFCFGILFFLTTGSQDPGQNEVVLSDRTHEVPGTLPLQQGLVKQMRNELLDE